MKALYRDRFKWLILLLTTFAVALGGVAVAGNPHFLLKKTVARLETVDPIAEKVELLMRGELGGLGWEEPIKVKASSEVSACFACMNNAGNFPDAFNKEEITGPEDETVEVVADTKGRAEPAIPLKLKKIKEQVRLVCPQGQKRVLKRARFKKLMMEVEALELRSDATPSAIEVEPFPEEGDGELP